MKDLPAFSLRPYQVQCVQNTISDLQEHNKLGIIMPTGSGKTECFAMIAERYLQMNQEKSVMVFSHLSLLTQQTLERFNSRLPHRITSVFQADQMPDSNAHVIISTMQTSRDGRKSDSMKFRHNRDIGLVIIDEAHYLDNPSYNLALNEWFPEAKQIGCTATPFRSGALMTNYFDKISFSISLQELIDQGFLVPPNLIEVAFDAKELPDVMAMTAKLYLEREKGRKALVFMTSIEDAKQMRNVLDNHGVNARAITSELVGEERDKILAAFRRGEIDVLTTVNVLTAGFDSPNVEAIFMPYPTQSPTTYLQRVGRGLRPCPEVGKKDCRIYVCGDSPSIKRELYRKVHDAALEAGAPKRKNTTFLEDLEYNESDKSSEIYNWTVTVCETVAKMQSLGMEQLAERLNHKKFPKKFLQNIAVLSASLGKNTAMLPYPSDPASLAQLNFLKEKGFTDGCLEGLKKGEASNMIAAVMNMKQVFRDKDPFILPTGKFAGRHVQDTSWFYRSHILSKAPASEIAKIIRDWEKQGGSYKKATRRQKAGNANG